jgi:hypothetical protein
MIKALKKLGIEGITQHSKDYKWETYSQHYTEWGKTERISSKIKN